MRTVKLTDEEFVALIDAARRDIEDHAASGDDAPKALVTALAKLRESR